MVNVIGKELKMNLNTVIEKLFDIFDKQGYELYLVGGAVRNSLLGLPIKDYDFTTNATPTQMREIVQKYNSGIDNNDKITIIPTGERYGTLTFRFHNTNYEITTFRKDGTYSDGRRPNEVNFSNNIYEDLSRRDFTINAIAYNPKLGLIDPYGGQRDIEYHIIKTVGNPTQRFSEDALRMLRALRLAYKLNFNIDKDTQEAIISNVKKLLLIAKERINIELMEILNYYHSQIADEAFFWIMQLIFQPIDTGLFKGELFELEFLESPLERLVYLYWITGRSRETFQVKQFLYDMKFEGRIIHRVVKLVFLLNQEIYENFLRREENYNLKVQIKKWLFVLGEQDIRNFIRLKLQLDIYPSPFTLYDYFDSLSQIIINQEPYTFKQLAINGNDIIILGFKGKEVGVILQDIVEYIWSFPEHNNKTDLILFINNKYQNSTILSNYELSLTKAIGEIK